MAPTNECFGWGYLGVCREELRIEVEAGVVLGAHCLQQGQPPRLTLLLGAHKFQELTQHNTATRHHARHSSAFVPGINNNDNNESHHDINLK
eukprot:COSAG06_NODE_32559_length_503_cov_675.225248_2_plen_92_part_01